MARPPAVASAPYLMPATYSPPPPYTSDSPPYTTSPPSYPPPLVHQHSLAELAPKAKCPRCKNVYDHEKRLPKIVPQCNHTVCLDCIHKLLAYEFWTLRCPVCCTVTELPLRNRLQALPVDRNALHYRHLFVNLAFVQPGDRGSPPKTSD